MFNELLKSIGFDTKLISARVYDSKTDKFGAEFDHMAILVNLKNSEYLIDVGFGEFTFYPLKFKLNIIQTDARGKFIIEKYNHEYFKVSMLIDDMKSIQYKFSKKERILAEYSERCNYHQTSSISHFTHKKLITRPTENGRITLTGNTLKITENKNVIKEEEFQEQEFNNYLFKFFGIKVQ